MACQSAQPMIGGCAGTLDGCSTTDDGSITGSTDDKVCCMAMTADCMACKVGKTAKEYCG